MGPKKKATPWYKTLDIELLEGKVFDREKESDSLSYFIINQAAMNAALKISA